MKYIPTLMLLLIFNSILKGQQALPRTWIKNSLDGNYTVTVSGDYYEEFAGPQIIRLVYHDSVLWQKEMDRRGLHLPCVSNDGHVIVTKWNKLSMFDKTGDLQWEFELDSLSFCPYYGTHLDIVQLFSVDDHFYFTFIHDSKSNQTFLICYSIENKKEAWRINLGDYRESSIRQIDDLLVFHDFSVHAKDYINTCYIVDLSGTIKWKYRRYLKRDLFDKIQYNTDDNVIEVIFFDKVEKYFLSETKVYSPNQSIQP